jgi:hypothetical protein
VSDYERIPEAGSFVQWQLLKPISTATTDAEGRFVLKSRPRQPTSLAAKTTRTVNGAAEHYYWIVSVGGQSEVLLSHANLLTAEYP